MWLEEFENKVKTCSEEEFAELKRRTIEQEKIRKETKVEGMPDDYKFTVEDEEIYVMFLATTTSSDVTNKEIFLKRVKRIRFRFNNADLDGLIRRIVESSEEEFAVFRERCMAELGF